MKMQESVLRRVRIMEEKNGIRYAKKGERLYTVLRVLYGLIGVYTVAINLLFIAGMMLRYGTDMSGSFTAALITVSICTGLIVAGYIMISFPLDLPGGLISAAAEVFLVLTFAHLMEDSLGFKGYKYSFYWRHLIPLVLLVILITWMTVIAVRAKSKTKRQYKRVLENLYQLYHTGSGADVTEEQWQELRQYDPRNYRAVFKAAEEKAPREQAETDNGEPEEH